VSTAEAPTPAEPVVAPAKTAMARPSIEPVTEATLPEFARFLCTHLHADRTAAAWEAGLRTQWSADAGNYGFVLRDKGEIVGGIGAYYADRWIRGQRERTCNITSWCVLDGYRQQSVRLAMSLLNQGGYHFTNFSPTTVVGSTLKFFKFKELDERVVVVLNLPCIPIGATQLLVNPAAIEAALQGEALKIYHDHAMFPWLRHVLIGRPGHWCHVIYKRRSYKGLPCADLLYISDRDVFASAFRRLAGHLLRKGMLTTHAEHRALSVLPWPAAIRTGFNPKLFLSASLTETDIDCLYSESVALDL